MKKKSKWYLVTKATKENTEKAGENVFMPAKKSHEK